MIKEVKEKESVFESLSDLGHEQVVYCHDKASGLKAIIGVHNTVLGPAVGGTRMWMYENEAQALHDVLRLSRGMTFKNAVAGLNAGGGKAVIIGDARKHKNESLLRAFGNFIENLNGKYITAEDVGMTARDMEFIKMQTDYVSGLPDYLGGLGDPSPHTAYGTYMGMKAAAKVAYGKDSLEGKKVTVQGVGSVGKMLIEYLIKENCEVFVSDYYQDRLQEVANQHKVTAVGLEEIYDVEADIYSPCALGATINDDSLSRLKCDIIVGCANNQLEDEEKHGDQCIDKNIIYAPDFVVNSGGVINVYSEFMGGGEKWTQAYTEMIYDKSLKILQTSYNERKNSQQVAIESAMERINSIASIH